MKRICKVILICLVLSNVSCIKSKNNSSASSDTTTTPDTGTSPDVNNQGTTQTTSNVPANCTGTTSDGTGDGYAIHSYRMTLAGHQSWMPGNYSDPLQTSTMPKVQEASLVFSSDSKLKIRFKVHSQPYPTAGEVYCYGRETGKASDPYQYTKLRFRLHLRDIICDTPNAQDPTKCDSELRLGERYRTQYIEPISVDYCSSVIDLGSIRNATTFGTAIEVDDVKADSTCQYNSTYCPAEKIVRTASCWDMTLQVVTDYTQDFK